MLFILKKGVFKLQVFYSRKLIKIAKKKTSKSTSFHIKDIRKLESINATYDGIWASASLLHIPKSQIKAVLFQIFKKLNANGVLYLSLKEGFQEGLERDYRYEGTEKYWAYYTKYEITTLIKMLGFIILDDEVDKTDDKKNSSSSYATHRWIEILAQKKNS
jgi:2-polyprenyl-3-methyl-5-hydroxy-6-metoxy-1,4-benzoquinol methylase